MTLPSARRRSPRGSTTSPAEDVHHFVEMALVERLGPLGYKLHTARSRNELVATDFRMFVKDAVRETARGVRGLIARARRIRRARHGRAHAGHDAPAARAAAAVFAFFAGACRGFLPRSGAAGSRASDGRFLSAGLRARWADCAFPMDREALARELGFARVSANSLDAVGDRDFALDYLYALSTLAHIICRIWRKILFCSPRRSSASWRCRTNIRLAAA